MYSLIEKKKNMEFSDFNFRNGCGMMIIIIFKPTTNKKKINFIEVDDRGDVLNTLNENKKKFMRQITIFFFLREIFYIATK